MAGIALKGQADLTSIMVPLGVLSQRQTMKEMKIGKYCSCFLYKKRFIRPNRFGEMMKGVSRRRRCHVPLFVYFERNFL